MELLCCECGEHCEDFNSYNSSWPFMITGYLWLYLWLYLWHMSSLLNCIQDAAHKHKMNSRALQLISQWCMWKPSENDTCCLRNSSWSNSHRHAGDTPRMYFYCHKKLHISSDLKMLLNLATLIAITDYLSTQKHKLHFKWKPQQA